MRFLDVTLDTYQNTSGYILYLGLFITIHQDTPRYKITIHVSWTRHDDTSRYKHTIRIHKGYIRDTCGIHAGYMYLQRFEDTCRIHTCRYMHDSSRIHAGYIIDTCICKGNQETCGIHPRYMMRYMYMYLKFVPSRIQTRPQVELEIRILEGIPMYPTCIVSVSCVVSEG